MLEKRKSRIMEESKLKHYNQGFVGKFSFFRNNQDKQEVYTLLYDLVRDHGPASLDQIWEALDAAGSFKYVNLEHIAELVVTDKDSNIRLKDDKVYFISLDLKEISTKLYYGCAIDLSGRIKSNGITSTKHKYIKLYKDKSEAAAVASSFGALITVFEVTLPKGTLVFTDDAFKDSRVFVEGPISAKCLEVVYGDA